MKPLQGDSVNNNSCSCTSCDSKSESDRQTLKRLLIQGSKINKLLTCKYYIHLRDSNLLETLIKTRALYDALRSQLLSSTESSTADLRPSQSIREIKKTFGEAKKSSDIFKLVDLVDKGAVIGLKKISECCSCCTCSSKLRLYENVQKGRRNRQAHAGGNIGSRSSLVSKQETGEAKNIKSDPCTCTCACYKNKNIKKSRETTEKICPEQQIIEQDRLSTASNNHKPISLNTGKFRKSHHKLKRAKACPFPYMENIGEGGNKIIRKSKKEIALEKKKSTEMLKLAQKTLLDGFKTDRQTLKKKESCACSMVGNTAEECMIHVKKTVTTSKDRVGKRQAPSPELKKSLLLRSRKQNQARKENTNESMDKISDTSSTSNTIIQKEAPFTTGNARQQNQSKAKKRKQKPLQQAASVAESNTDISKKGKQSFHLGGSNQVQKSKESKIPPQKDPTEVADIITKQLPISSTPGKDPIESNTDTIPGIQKSVSIDSIKKSDPASFNKTSSDSLKKLNKPKLKSRSSVSFRKRLRLLSAPLRYRPHPQIKEEPSLHKEPAPARHKKPSGLRRRNLKSGSHALKRCFCTVKLKINETKTKISKNVSNENINFKHNQRINSKTLLSSVKTFIKAPNLNLHASISDCICDEHNQPNIEFGVKSTSNHHVSNDPKFFHLKDQRGKSNTRLRTKSTVKDASITTEKPRKLQNEAVQTVINITSKQKYEVEISMKQLEKKKPDICNPRFSIELFNKGYKNGLKITQSKEKFVCKCGDGTKQLPNKQSQTSSSTQRFKFTSTKHGLRRCFCTLQLGTQEKKKYNQRKVTMIQPTNKVEGSRAKLKIVRHDNMPYKYDFNICSPKRCFSQRLMVELVKKERNLKKHIKTKSRYFNLASRSMQLPRTKNIHSTLTSPNSENLILILKRNKRKPSDVTTHQGRSIFSRKLLKSKRFYCLCSPIDKDNKMNKYTKICSSKDLQKLMLLRNKKLEQSSLFGLTRKRCLCTCKLNKKGTKFTDSKYSDQLRPYESKCLEPFLLENNKSNTLKHFGCVTDKTKMKSKSSDTRALRSTSKLLFVKSDLQQRNTSLQKFKKMRNYSDLSHLPQRGREMYLNYFLKQSVKMGSNFSFNIEFYKGITPENNYNHNRTKNMNVHFLHNKQECNRLTKIYSSHRNTKRLSPTPNRCLYTLKISKMELRDNKLLLPFGTKQLTQVYAVSTVAIAENKIKTPEILEVDHDFPCIDSYYPTYSNYTSSHSKQWQYFNKSPTSGLPISMIALKTKNVQSYIRESKYRLLQISSKDQSLLDFASNDSVRFETAFSCDIDYLNNIRSKKRQTLRTAQSQTDTLELRQRTPKSPETERTQNITHFSQLTGVQPLLRRCYCTMNIQVARQKRKLLDYECEPGICVPGDCDPYECQKLIMKRLKRHVSRMSGTESRSRSSFSETTSTGSAAKKVQSGFGEPKHRTRGYGPRSRSRPRRRPVRPQGLKYQTLPRTAQAPAPAHRQAVRVGSTFSFDIEFSKGSSKSAPTTDFVKIPKRQMMSRSSTTYHRQGMDRGTKYGGRRYHRGTESMMKQMRHRASSVRPMMKRCFCTLKLQKKGRQQKERELRGTDHGTSTPPKFSFEKPILRTTERGQNTRRKQRSPELLPYECEPGICVPGECDPYECLELIKRRNKHTKDFGTDSMASSKSSSSMTSSHKQKRKRIQSRNIRARKVRSRDTLVTSKPSVMSLDRPVQDRPSKPSRQAVKISSNLSFNIEFYRDCSGNDSNTRPSEVYVQKPPKKLRKVRKQVYAHRRMRESSSQYRKGTRDDDSQIGIYQRGRSTMTSSFLKRCFCTAKLQGINVDAVQGNNVDAVQGTNADAVQGINVDAATGARQHRSISKFIQCLCKLATASKRLRQGSNVGHERATPISDKRVGMTQTKGRSPALLPYECEPGVCEPGFCDPHECIKLIRKRLGKEKMTGTAGPRTTSTSSSFSSSQPSRSTMTQSRASWPRAKMTQARPARRRKRSRRRDYAPRERVLQEPVVSSVSPQRQAVRIGSNFSFNIEFYKDKDCNNLDVEAAAPLVKRSRPIRMRERGHGSYRRMRTRDRGLRGRRFPARSRDSQMDSTKSRDIGLGPILRRCFCTLKLQKQAKIKGKTKALTKAASKAEAKVDTKAETGADIGAETKAVSNETEGKKKKHKCLCTPPKEKCLCIPPKEKCLCGPPVKEKCLCTPPIKQVATLHTKSVMTVKKPKRRKAFPYKLEPYECEPGICVPGECDPYECLKLINKRLMYSSGTSTDRRGRRSSSIMTDYGRGYRHSETQSFMPRKKKARTRDTRTRHRERRPYRERRPHRERRPYRERRPKYSSTVVEKTTKQAVKLGSSFNFDIEFFRDKSLGGPVVTSRPIKRGVAYDRPKRTSSRSTEWQSTYSRNKKVQHSRKNRHMDSQALSQSMRSTMTETVAPFLKRCFCTLQLHCKTENQGTPFDCLSHVSKRGIVKSQTKRETSNEKRKYYSRKQAQFSGRKLLPYECEPGFCVPGECDPYECLKRIRRRMQSKQAGTESYKYRSISSSTDGEKKYVPRRSYPSRRNVKTSQCEDQCQDVIGSRSISSSSNERRKHRPRIKARSYSPSWRYEKTSRDQFQVDSRPKRQAARIGSNFSFEIEFFKDNSPQTPRVREVNKIVKKEEKNRVNRRSAKRKARYVPRSKMTNRGTVARPKTTKSMSSCGRKDCHRDVQSQLQFKRTDKGIGTPLLKRCFCTLKLEKKGKQRYITRNKIEPSFNNVFTHTKSKTKAKIEPVAREIGTKTKNCKCNTINKNCKCNAINKNCKCNTINKNCKCNAINKNCKCNTINKNCKCYAKSKNCKCDTKNKNCKCYESCECVTEQKAEPDEFPCKEGKECKCCRCNTYALQSNGYRCKKGKKCTCLQCNTPAFESYLEPNEFPCKKGKECKCCKCNAMDAPLKQNQNVIPVKKDKCACDNGPKAKTCKCFNVNKNCKCYTVNKNCKCNTKNKNCKCYESCACETVQTSDKKTSTKEKYDPLQKFEPVECGKVCEPRRMSGTPDTRSTRTSRVSSIAAQFIPGYTHKRIKYKGEPYSPEEIDSIVEEPRYPFLHGKDARQGVKITSDFTFNIEFFKEMLPPVVDNTKRVDNKIFPFPKNENIRDAKIGHYVDKKDSYSTKLQSRSERTETTSSPVALLRKCFCTRTQKPIHPQSLAMYRVEEIRPMSCFQPRDYWVQYQTQQTTKYFKTNPEELETIMSYAPSTYDKINNNKDCRSCRKTNFNRVYPTKKGAHLKAIPKHSETKQSTLKKMFYYCKNLFTKRSNKQNIKNTERCMELKTKATNKQPLIDILKPSKSERHPNKAVIADFKISKSLKATKVSGTDDYKKKYSRFQSGDHQGTKSQNTGVKLKKNCQHCQIKFKHAIPIQDKVRFTTLRTNKALKCKPKYAIVTEKEKYTKPVSFLFKSLKFKNSEDIKNLELCSCCGGIKRIRNLPSASNFLDIKNKLLEYSEDAITTIISKDLIAIPTKNNIPKVKTELTQKNQKKNNQSCPCCVCKSASKPNTKQGKKDCLGVCGRAVCKREAERRAENTHHAECIECKRQYGTPICSAESEKEALASESGCHRAPNQKKKKENLEQAKSRGNFRKAEDKKIVIENKIKEKSKKVTKYKNTPDSLLVAESVLDISKLELKSTGDSLSSLHRPVSDPKCTYRKCQSYLRDSMRAWNKILKPANNDPGLETLQFLKLRCQATKCVKAGEEILEDYLVTNFGKHSNNADRKKGFHPKKAILAASSGLWRWMKESIHAFAKKEAVA